MDAVQTHLVQLVRVPEPCSLGALAGPPDLNPNQPGAPTARCRVPSRGSGCSTTPPSATLPTMRSSSAWSSTAARTRTSSSARRCARCHPRGVLDHRSMQLPRTASCYTPLACCHPPASCYTPLSCCYAHTMCTAPLTPTPPRVQVDRLAGARPLPRACARRRVSHRLLPERRRRRSGRPPPRAPLRDAGDRRLASRSYQSDTSSQHRARPL